MQVADGDKVPVFTQRKKLMDARLVEIVGKDALTSSKRTRGDAPSLQHRRDLGELTHIFSHVKHHMGIEHLHFASQPSVGFRVDSEGNGGAGDELVSSSVSSALRWMNADEMQQLGITTGVKKILGLVAKAAAFGAVLEATSSSITKSEGLTTSSQAEKTTKKVSGGTKSQRARSLRETGARALTKFFAK